MLAITLTWEKRCIKKISGLPLFKHAQTRNFFFNMQHSFGKQKEERIQGYLSTIHTGHLQNKTVGRTQSQKVDLGFVSIARNVVLFILDICANRKGKLYTRNIEYKFMKLGP